MPYANKYKRKLWEQRKAEEAIAIIEKRGRISMADLVKEMGVTKSTFITRINHYVRGRVYVVGNFHNWMYEVKTPPAVFD